MRSIVNAIRDMLKLAGSLGGFIWSRKAWWMVPIVLVMLLVLVLVILAETPSGPSIYTLF